MSRISVCMIVKNEEKYIEGALKSVLPVACEIIVADTGSSDKTPQMAKEMSATVMEIAWNNDFSQARNAVLEKASGD